ncbi:TPA: hypothetical protein ACH3X2_000150 [Trebouxia sp. C0005]
MLCDVKRGHEFLHTFLRVSMSISLVHATVLLIVPYYSLHVQGPEHFHGLQHATYCSTREGSGNHCYTWQSTRHGRNVQVSAECCPVTAFKAVLYIIESVCGSMQFKLVSKVINMSGPICSSISLDELELLKCRCLCHHPNRAR